MEKNRRTEVAVVSEYPELTAEEYRQKISKAFERIEDIRVLRYFYIFIYEKLTRIYVKNKEV